jgi:nondiscriminating glutamyl-tRNA synthetase
MMIYQALGFELPQFGHLSIILGSDKQKLSKRHGATSISQYKELGYLPEAMNNFLALMGWSSPKGEEIMSLNSMIEQFSTDRFNPAPAVFDEVKLKWMNATHLRSLPLDDLWNRIEPLLSAQGFILPEDKNWRHKALEVFKTSMELLNDSIELFRPLSKTDLVLDEKAKDVLTWEKTNIVLETWIELLKTKGDIISSDLFIEMQDQVKEKCEVKGKFLFMPIRVAVIGKAQGAELKNLVPLLDKNELIKRAEFVKKHI